MKDINEIIPLKKVIKIILQLMEIFFSLVLSIIVIAPIIGTAFAFFDLYWGKLAICITIVVAIMMTYFLYKQNVFRLDGKKDILAMILVSLVTMYVYITFSPVLEINQDPSIYMLKALNLVNYGHTYKPANLLSLYISENPSMLRLGEYAGVCNGTQLAQSYIETDFYPGGAFFYAIIGSMKKTWIFYGQTIIMIANANLLYFILKKIAYKENFISSILMVLTFVLSPIAIWFGRGSFSEPVALLGLLLIINVLLTKDFSPWLLAITCLIAYTSRIDYVILLVIGVFLINLVSRKVGLIFTVSASALIYICSKTYWIYYNRIILSDMPILRYGIYMLIIMEIISFLIATFLKDKLEEFYRSKIIKNVLLVIGIIVILLVFRNNIIPSSEYSIELIHENLIRTYEEDIFDLLFMVFPSIVLLGGILSMHKMQEDKKIPFLASGFLVGIMTVYFYFYYKAGNSPQLYWLLRRYLNINIPLALISFSYYISRFEKRAGIGISLLCCILSLNLYLESGQIVDYDGLNKSIVAIDDSLENDNIELVLYEESMKYEISSLLSYSEAEFMPVPEDVDLYDFFDNIIEEYDVSTEKALYISTQYIEDIIEDEFVIEYKKQGETYGQVPKDVYSRKYTLYAYRLDSVMSDENRKTIYPNFVSTVDGVDEDKWTCGLAEISLSKSILVEEEEYIVIKMCDYDNYFFINNLVDELDLRIEINDKYIVEMLYVDEGYVYFEIPKGLDEIKKVIVSSNTFNGSNLGLSDDSRDLGISIDNISIE